MSGQTKSLGTIRSMPRRGRRQARDGCPADGGGDRLLTVHGQLKALRLAVAFKRFRAADVRSILAAGTGTPQPRPAGDALVLDLPTRSLDAYKVTRDGSAS
jgi:hypothetical protein